MNTATLTLYHIPGCPFSERVEILARLKGLGDYFRDEEIDTTKPRPDWLLEKTQGTTSLPVFDTPHGPMKESLVILRYLEGRFPNHPVAQRDPWLHAIEGMMAAMDQGLSAAGYGLLRNQDPAQREPLTAALEKQFDAFEAFLLRHNPDGVFLFEAFGWAETILTPLFKRILLLLDHYEGYALPACFPRLSRWVDGCMSHPATQLPAREMLVKLYYDYSRGASGAAMLPDRTVRSFAMEPHWSTRPLPPRGKWDAPPATDAELGLLSPEVVA